MSAYETGQNSYPEPTAERRRELFLDASAELERLRAQVVAMLVSEDFAGWSRDHDTAIKEAARVYCSAAAEIARLRSELEEARRERAALLEAARGWWEGSRPVDWCEEEHIANPRVNLTTAREYELATLVAAIAAQGAAQAKTGELIEHLQKTGRLAPCFNLPALDAARELTRKA